MKPRQIPRIEVNFNELVEDFQVLLSKEDSLIDCDGNIIVLQEGLEIEVFEPDFDENNKRDDIEARGYATRYNNPLYEQVKWCCKIDEKGFTHSKG